MVCHVGQKKSILALADGKIFSGVSVGVEGYVCGEVVFNTAQTGYQEILTDPSYSQQIVVFTHPHIGNVGINDKDMESERVSVYGAVMRSFSDNPSNWRAQGTLASFFRTHQVVGISEIDTRALTQHLRNNGSQFGCIISGAADAEQAVYLAQNKAAFSVQAKTISHHQEKSIHSIQITQKKISNHALHVVVYDFGVKLNILKCLQERCFISVVPADISVDQVIALRPNGILLSNGPGDPESYTKAITDIQRLLVYRIPIMGVCLGHQLLALASGAKTEKMKFGHHGVNHPIQSLKTGKVAISSQNHGFVVSKKDFPNHLNITYQSLFDSSIAGIERIDTPAFGFQGHPEASPGPTELSTLFNDFISMMEAHRA